MKPMDIIDALDNVDKGLLLRSEQPVHQRSRLWDGVKIAAAAALLVAVGIGGFLLLRGRTSRSPEPIPAYSLPVFETREPTDPPLQTVTPVAYSTNWEGLETCWLSEWGAVQAQRQPGEDFAPLPDHGEVPEAARRIVDGNLFYGAEAFGDRLLVAAQEGSALSVSHYDKYGVFLGKWTDDRGDGWSVVGKTVTSDGGFLLALALCAENNYTVRRSAVVKCDATGAVRWETDPAKGAGVFWYYCFERDGAYYLFGHQDLDVCMLCMDADGSVRERLLLSDLEFPEATFPAADLGFPFLREDYHFLEFAEPTEEGFTLYIRSHSNNSNHGHGMLAVDSALNVLSWQMTGSLDLSARSLGVVDDEPLLSTDERLADFPYGRLTAVLDLGDRILTVSEHQTEGSADLVGTGAQLRHQTVYASFDKRGALLWRAAADDGHTAIPVKQTSIQLSLPQDLGSLLPDSAASDGIEARISGIAQECMKQYARFLEKNRKDLEWIAAELLRLRKLSLSPDAPAHDLIMPSSSPDAPEPDGSWPTPYFGDHSLSFISSAVQAEADDALQPLLRKLAERGGFESIDARQFPFSESSADCCCFHSYHTLYSGSQRYQISIDLYYCGEPRMEQPVHGGNNETVEWLDDRWCWVFRWEGSQN